MANVVYTILMLVVIVAFIWFTFMHYQSFAEGCECWIIDAYKEQCLPKMDTEGLPGAKDLRAIWNLWLLLGCIINIVLFVGA